MINELLNDKNLKPKDKTAQLAQLILAQTISVNELIAFSQTAKDSPKATCIEALEFATQQQPTLLNKAAFNFVVDSLTAKAPRIKWESAKVLANTVTLFKTDLNKAIDNLLTNTEHEGTVVRWSAAQALTAIVKLNTKHNTQLLPAIQSIAEREEKNSIKKIYADALKKIKA